VVKVAVVAALLSLGVVGLPYFQYFPYWRAVLSDSRITFRAESGLPVWTVDVLDKGHRLLVHGVRIQPRPLNYSYELWAWPDSGEPVSLGRLPTGGTETYDLNSTQREALAAAGRLVVTIEPRGAPLTGHQSRRVILSAPLEAVMVAAEPATTG
jgi:hypothetical protein